MKKIFILLASVMFSFMLSAEEAQKSERFYFFYSESCPHCHEAMPFVEELEKEFPNIEFKKLELSKGWGKRGTVFLVLRVLGNYRNHHFTFHTTSMNSHTWKFNFDFFFSDDVSITTLTAIS